MKPCSVCSISQPEENFGGGGKRCKACMREKTKAWYKRNRSRAIASVRKWEKAHPEKLNAAKRARRARKAVQTAAHLKLQRAVRSGMIAKPDSCQECQRHLGKAKIHGHHHDGYTDPLKVQWLCARCHLRAHGAEAS